MQICRNLACLRTSLFVLNCALVFGFVGLSVWAQESCFDMGISEYQKQNFTRAISYFETTVATDPSNSEAFYYTAITYEQLGNYRKALDYYRKILAAFPQSKAAILSEAAINRPEFRKIARSKGVLTGIDSSLDLIPKETWIGFVRKGNSLVVEGQINGHPTKMIFDTGASACVFSVDQLERLGVDLPKGEPASFGAGVGSSNRIPMWTMTADLKLDRIERRSFPILVSPSPLPYPLLGENYYSDLEYTIDNQNKAILFKSRQDQKSLTGRDNQAGCPAKMTVSASGNYVYNVPFKVDNQSLVVVAKLDGKDCSMIFDTGADVCLFTEPQIEKLGIKLRWLGKSIKVTGTGGVTRAPLCEIENAQIGPISGPMLCLVSNQTLMSKPLLGQTFFKNWHFTIDHAKSVIQFVKE